MIGWRKWLLAVACLLGGVVFCLHTPSRPPVHLKITRQGIEQGKPVVFFRVEEIKHRWLAVGHVCKLVGNRVQDMAVKDSDGDWIRTPDFWAPSQQSDPPIGCGGADKREVGVTAPTNIAVWKLRVEVDIEERYSLRKCREIIRRCASAIKHGRSVTATARGYWNNDIYFRPVIVDSDPITNSVIPQIFSR
jgi:hypothetical protein